MAGTGLVTTRPTAPVFADLRFPPQVISAAARWYLRYGLSYCYVADPLYGGYRREAIFRHIRLVMVHGIASDVARPARILHRLKAPRATSAALPSPRSVW